MTPETATYHGPSAIDMLGVYPLVLALAAIIIGIASFVIRKQNANLALSQALVGLGSLGAGATAWRLFRMYSSVGTGDAVVDPNMWTLNEGEAWMAAGVVLPAVGVGLLMVAVSALFTRSPSQEP